MTAPTISDEARAELVRELEIVVANHTTAAGNPTGTAKVANEARALIEADGADKATQAAIGPDMSAGLQAEIVRELTWLAEGSERRVQDNARNVPGRCRRAVDFIGAITTYGAAQAERIAELERAIDQLHRAYTHATDGSAIAMQQARAVEAEAATLRAELEQYEINLFVEKSVSKVLGEELTRLRVKREDRQSDLAEAKGEAAKLRARVDEVEARYEDQLIVDHNLSESNDKLRVALAEAVEVVRLADVPRLAKHIWRFHALRVIVAKDDWDTVAEIATLLDKLETFAKHAAAVQPTPPIEGARHD